MTLFSLIDHNRIINKYNMGVILLLRAGDLRQKEVINISDGLRLGFVSDVEIDFENGKIDAIIVPGPTRAFGLLGRREDYIISWSDIKKVGDDIILVEINKYKQYK